MVFAVLFPGQGSQEVGMGADLFDARPDLLVDAADETLGWSLRDVCLDGPLESLTSTDRAQPALFALAYVLWLELRSRLDRSPSAGAGHSLGEYTALAAADALGFSEALHLVATRGKAMASAAAAADSAMAALVGADDELAVQIAADRREAGGSLWVANFNAPGQVVLAGSSRDIAWLVDNARDLGVRRAIPLTVAGAFHSPYMEPALTAVEAALANVDFCEPAFDVFSNVTAEPMRGSDIAGLAARQMVSPVRFSDSLAAMAAARIEVFVHVGPGDVTAGLAKRAARGSTILVANELERLDAIAGELSVAVQ